MEEQIYSLKWNPNPPLRVANLVTYAVAWGLYTALAWASVTIAFSGVPGISSFYIAMGFLIPFVLWFSGWGVVIGVLGAIVGVGILTGMPVPQAVSFGLVEAAVQIPFLIVYRLLAPRFGVSPIGRDVFTAKGFIFFLLVAVALTQLWSAVSGVLTNYALGMTPADLVVTWMMMWWLTNCIVVAVIGTIILGVLTPVVERLGLTVRGIIT
ncbi:MAG: hypothetical protein GTO63_00645 [Anaerolineae bacterium]|nr:hypothetical protein [Anaerolineae bacterium]NIN93514.1 hypothetical protein [Anaerolineae bacterium]NIQ76588.1 hypothetical protein [Anaerolineae bacterium]